MTSQSVSESEAARAVLREVAEDRNAPASARVQAALALLNLSPGDVPGKAKAPPEMDLDAIEREIAAISGPTPG